jgi:hypothetical protein
MGRVEHILAVKNDVLRGADMLQETGADIFAFRNAPFQNAGDFFENGQRRGDEVTGLAYLADT